MTFYVFFELPRTFSRTLVRSTVCKLLMRLVQRQKLSPLRRRISMQSLTADSTRLGSRRHLLYVNSSCIDLEHF